MWVLKLLRDIIALPDCPLSSSHSTTGPWRERPLLLLPSSPSLHPSPHLAQGLQCVLKEDGWLDKSENWKASRASRSFSHILVFQMRKLKSTGVEPIFHHFLSSINSVDFFSLACKCVETPSNPTQPKQNKTLLSLFPTTFSLSWDSSLSFGRLLLERLVNSPSGLPVLLPPPLTSQPLPSTHIAMATAVKLSLTGDLWALSPSWAPGSVWY